MQKPLMTVYQLIEKLKEFDPDLEVGYSGLGYSPAVGVKQEETDQWEYPGVRTGSKKTVVKIF